MPRVTRVSAGPQVLPAIRAVVGLWPTIAGFLLSTSLAAPALAGTDLAAGGSTEVSGRLPSRRWRTLRPAADELARPRRPAPEAVGSPTQLVACGGYWSTRLSRDNPTSPAGWDRLMKKGLGEGL